MQLSLPGGGAAGEAHLPVCVGYGCTGLGGPLVSGIADRLSGEAGSKQRTAPSGALPDPALPRTAVQSSAWPQGPPGHLHSGQGLSNLSAGSTSGAQGLPNFSQRALFHLLNGWEGGSV